MLKVAIIGCGKIADIHASQIQRIESCEIVGVCDREELMAEQLAERFHVKRFYSDVAEMLRSSRPDVVHITTPPSSHYALAKQCLGQGCHAYVEKPFTLRAWEAEELIALANASHLKMTVGHDAQYSHAARRLRQLVKGGYLGGVPIHMESVWCYELTGQAYARAFLGDQHHWVRALPGGLLHNIISHGIAKVAEFVPTDSPQVVAHGFVSPCLRSVGEADLIDELRVIISDGCQTTAYFTFSSQIHPSLHRFSIYGPRHGLMLDEDQQTVIKLRGDRLKSYLEKFLPPLDFAWQHLGCVTRSVRLFLANDFHMESGIKSLIETFYSSIRSGAPLPIAYREILVTARIMDAIFDQLRAERACIHVAPGRVGLLGTP